MHYSLLYISRIVKPASADTLNAIREEAIERNQRLGLTGLLLCSHEHFCQILQGQKSAVEETMQRIVRDTRHSEPLVLLRTDLAEALFPDWSMATSQIDDPAMEKQIALAYQERLADLGVVDGIVALMQQFQRHSDYTVPVVNARSGVEQQLATLANKDSADRAVEQILKLGCSIFNGCALVLLLRTPTTGKLYSKASAGIEQSKIERLIEYLSIEPSADRVAQSATGSTDAIGQLHNAKLPPATGYQAATGCLISASTVSSTGLANATREQHTDPAVVIGALWILSGSEASEATAPAKYIELFRLAACLENLLEQRFSTHASELLKQKSRRQQLSLAASNRRQEMVMNVASSAIVAIDRDSRVLIINDAARQMFGGITDSVPFHWPQSIVFRTPWSLEPLPHSSCPIHLAATDGQVSDGESRSDEKGSNILTLQINESEPLRYLRVASSVTNEPDSAISGVVVFDDVTELQHNRERMRSDRLEALGHLTGGIAHDFNNLLSTIQSSVELATIEPNGQARQSFLDVALDSVQRGADLTDKLVAFAVARPVCAQAHRLKVIMQSVADLVTASIEQEINFVLEEVPESLAVYCDGGQLENALLNVLINSRDAIYESGTGDQVSVAVRSTEVDTRTRRKKLTSPSAAGKKSGKKVQIIVTDNGPGMSAEVIGRATDPFFTTRAAGSGSGLGLSMVYRFVEQSDGELLIENMSDIEPDTTGVRVTILLDQVLSQSVPEELPLSGKPEPLQSRATVLLVEDETHLAAMLQQSLHRYGLDTRVAHSADTALQELQADNDIDLLLTDIIMPGSELDGYSLATEAKRLKPDLRVVYLSGYPQPSGKSATTTFGPLIKKPVRMKNLAAVIRKELGHNTVQDNEQLLVPG